MTFNALNLGFYLSNIKIKLHRSTKFMFFNYKNFTRKIMVPYKMENLHYIKD
jgi:hypothetical protein